MKPLKQKRAILVMFLIGAVQIKARQGSDGLSLFKELWSLMKKKNIMRHRANIGIGEMVSCFPAPPDLRELTDPKRKGPLKLYRAYYIMSADQLAKIPEISYTSIALAWMIWPQLAYQPLEEFRI